MVFSTKQARALKAKLSFQHVKTRTNNGTTLAYLEGWHVIAEANRIFGFDNWDRKTLWPRCLWTEKHDGWTHCFYSTKVQVTVRAGETCVIREGIGTGVGRSSQMEIAHEIALKAAETDATKRALATFGNAFGLALYDKGQAGVTRPPMPRDAADSSLILMTANNRRIPCGSAPRFMDLAVQEVSKIDKVAAVYKFWESNRPALQQLSAASETSEQSTTIILKLKQRLRDLAKQASKPADGPVENSATSATGEAYVRPKEKRIRDKTHLAFVRTKPCLVCGRAPVHAHHLRFAQPRAMGMKVSDEFTVPVCAIHHDELHRTGDERAWWARHGIIEPLKIAERLWSESHETQVQGNSGTQQDLDGQAAANS